jgi:SAM-dependent methyltransferase
MSELKSSVPALPAYLRDTYSWAYLDERSVPWLDRPWIVDAILWGNAARLMDAAMAEFPAGANVLQAAAVYGDFSPRLARQIGPQGRLTVMDVAPIQVARTNGKLAEYPTARAFVSDLAEPLAQTFDAVCCFFLLHEVPPAVRARIVTNLLEAVRPGGKVVFVDYHRPRRGHLLGPLMRLVWRQLEPFAESLLDQRIAAIAPAGTAFSWREESFFGGLYQKVVGTRAPS